MTRTIIVMAIFLGGTVFCFYKYSEIVRAIYQKIYPLNTKVKVKVDREWLNSNYFDLDQEEKDILERTASCHNVWITRKIKNELVISIDEEEIVILPPQKKKITKEWIKFLKKKRYFTVSQLHKRLLAKIV